MKQTQFTIQTRLLTAFFLCALITLILGVTGRYGMSQAISNMEKTTSTIKARREILTKATDAARSAQVHFKIQVQEWKNILLRGMDPAAFEKHMKGFSEEEKITQQNLESFKSLVLSEGHDVGSIETAIKTHQELGSKYREALKSYDRTKPDSPYVVDAKVKGIDRAPTAAIDVIVESVKAFENANTSEDEKKLKAQIASFNLISTLSMVVAVLLALGLGLYLSSSISRVLKGIANELVHGSKHVTSAAGMISSASQSVAEGASEQAASLEQASSSLEELSSMTHRNADSTAEAQKVANEARKAADMGARDMETMIAAMGAIRSSSDQISKIIKTIDEIAFQTNILALNAAVEAARAGEAGMGFAVVAEEVRNLAHRSAVAARETSEKIESAIANTQSGFEISAKVDEALKEIVGKVRHVDELVQEVATATREQSHGLDQLNTAVTQMNSVTQTNASSAEESASASEELAAQAQTLNKIVRDLLVLVGGSVTADQETATSDVPPQVKHSSVTLDLPPPRKTLAAHSGRESLPSQSDFES